MAKNAIVWDVIMPGSNDWDPWVVSTHDTRDAASQERGKRCRHFAHGHELPWIRPRGVDLDAPAIPIWGIAVGSSD
jgi:hypothetical protein